MARNRKTFNNIVYLVWQVTPDYSEKTLIGQSKYQRVAWRLAEKWRMDPVQGMLYDVETRVIPEEVAPIENIVN